MKPYMHRVRLFDDVVGYDESATNSRIHVISWNPDAQPIHMVIGFYEFHKAYRPIEAEELALHLLARSAPKEVHQNDFISTMAASAEDVLATTSLGEDEIASMDLSVIQPHAESWTEWGKASGLTVWQDNDFLFFKKGPRP